MRSLRGSNAAAVIARLNPIIRGWAAYYRGVVSSKIFNALDAHVWRLTYKWANHSHPKKPKQWIVRRYFGRFNKFRNDRWVFGDPSHRSDRGDTYHMVKFSWTHIVRHQLVTGGASPDDPDLADLLGQTATAGQTPAGRATTCACSPGRTAAARSAGTICSPPTSHRSPHTSGNDGGWASSAGR